MRRNKKKLNVILVTIAVFLITACSSDVSNNDTRIVHFSSKEKAFQNYIKEENIDGSVVLIKTTKGDQLLLTQVDANTYFVGELKKDANGYYAVKITNNTILNNEALGMGWNFKSSNGNKYSIFFNKTNDNSEYISIPNCEFYVRLLVDENKRKNAIQEVETIK
ncbi:hypothetical protein [Paenibacillus sp. BSR1-1]|uniref:hypothetical protein n=1 Tax=Paenibacillus sp. BSR1-1 TaxID=3020845 RepID=UPI0025B21EF6|nr:hypothetical protein [Paenibacillus sp. BSR1-1]